MQQSPIKKTIVISIIAGMYTFGAYTCIRSAHYYFVEKPRSDQHHECMQRIERINTILDYNEFIRIFTLSQDFDAYFQRDTHKTYLFRYTFYLQPPEQHSPTSLTAQPITTYPTLEEQITEWKENGIDAYSQELIDALLDKRKKAHTTQGKYP